MSTNTRFACRVARLSSAIKGEGAVASSSGHVAACAECQAYFRGATALDAALRREAGGALPEGVAAPAGLEAGILRAVREARRDDVALELENAENATGGVRWWRPVVTFGTVAAVLAVGSFVFQRARAPGGLRGGRAEVVAVTAADARAIVATVSEASERLMGEVLPQTGTMIAQNPLQSEMKAVAEDARSAVDFLAMNFLPGRRVAAR